MRGGCCEQRHQCNINIKPVERRAPCQGGWRSGHREGVRATADHQRADVKCASRDKGVEVLTGTQLKTQVDTVTPSCGLAGELRRGKVLIPQELLLLLQRRPIAHKTK